MRRWIVAPGIRGDLVSSIDLGRIFTMQLPGVVNAQGGLVCGGTVKASQSWPSFPFTGNNVTLWVRAWEEDIFAPNAAFDDVPQVAAIQFVRLASGLANGGAICVFPA
jgi:hypothetical protein